MTQFLTNFLMSGCQLRSDVSNSVPMFTFYFIRNMSQKNKILSKIPSIHGYYVL